MRKRYMAAALLIALLVLLTGCARDEKDGHILRLFYPAPTYEAGGDVIHSQAVDWTQEEGADAADQVKKVVQLLQNPDNQLNFSSPIPQGTVLLQCTVSDGLAVLDFSSSYRLLSGLDMTVADYCITLSAAQISGVRQLQILVDGQPIPGRDVQIFTTEDVLLTSSEDVVKAVSVTLYFPDKDGALQPEKRELLIYEGENRCCRVMGALLEGPQTEGLSPLLPEGVTQDSVWMDGEVCCLNFSTHAFRLLCDETVNQQQVVQGLVRSLCSLDGVQSLQILVDGSYRTMLGPANIYLPLSP